MKKEKQRKPKLLLHSCCGPCSTSVVERLSDKYGITIFFYNPCITDREEYDKRRKAQEEFIEEYNKNHEIHKNVGYKEGRYDPDHFLKATKGLEKEKEGGGRCRICMSLRLEETARSATDTCHEYFGTTLSVSPHKNHSLILEIGEELRKKYDVRFIEDDFKKKDGFARSVKLSEEYKLYRQNYCGCEYSKRRGDQK